MDEVTILIKYSGLWVGDNVYETQSMEGVVVRRDISFVRLKDEISSQIHVDQTRNHLRLRYVVPDNAVPMEIRNDMGVRVFVSLINNNTDFAKYPLCVDIVDMDITNITNATTVFDTCTGAIDCSESVNQCRALALVEGDLAMSISDTNEDAQLHVIIDPKHRNIRVKQTYKDKETLVAVMHNYALEHRFQFHAKRSEPKCYELICYVEGCPWHFRASRIKDSKLYKVRKFDNVHSCPLPERRFRQRQATIKMVANFSISQLTNHKRKYTAADIREDVLKNMGVVISYNKAWRSKELALKTLLGGPAEGYLQLPRYLHVLGSRYPGSYLKYHTNEKNQFMYLFIALGVSIKGFDNCRPLVVVDGSHMKGPYMGTFVSASTLDGAGHILPLAYGVIDSENDASWQWFFEQFRGAFGVRKDMGIVSDRNASIWKAARIVFPEVCHFACIWHLWKNVCSEYRKSQETLSSIYYQMAKAYRRDEFDECMAEVERIDRRVSTYLRDAGYDKWARAYAPINRGGMTISNIAECINACLLDARKLPFLDFLEKARELFARWNVINGEKSRYMAPSRLGDRFYEIYTLNDMRSIGLMVVKNSEFIYSVDSVGARYIVCLQKRTCSCCRFQYDGVPCEHAIAVLKSKSITDIMPFCSDYYKKATLEKIYEDPFPPMPLKKDWTAPESVLKEVVLPPGYKRPAGRPRNGRVKNKSESLRSTTNCCSRCKRAGHNRRSCNFFPNDSNGA